MKGGLIDKFICKENNSKHSQNVKVVTYMWQIFHLAYIYYSLNSYLNCALENHSNTRMSFQHDTILKGPQNIPHSAVASSVLLNEYFGRIYKKEWDGLGMRNVRVGRQLDISFRWENIKGNNQLENFSGNGKVLFKRIFMK